MGRVRVTTTLTSRWLPSTINDLDLAVLDMTTDIDREAGILAAKDTRALYNSGRIKRNSVANYSVIYGGGQVPYALLRHNVNFKTPSSIGYLEKPGDRIAKNVRKYIRKNK